MGGDYVVPIKGNQGAFLTDLELYFDDKKLETIIAGNSDSSYLKQVEKAHGNVEIYEYFQTNDVNWYFDHSDWKDLHSIGLIKKTIIKNGKEIQEKRYYISSLYTDIYLFSKAIRNHWNVENKLHWHLDFTFKEDDNTTANKTALMNLQIIDKFILATLNKVKHFYNIKSLKHIRSHISNNFQKFFVDLICYLLCS